jgi:hypothetical protein
LFKGEKNTMANTNLTFEKVWLMFQETDKRFQETARQHKETERMFRETDKKLRSLETLFTTRWGKLMESLVEGDLIKLLNEKGISVNRTSQRSKTIYNKEDFELDIAAKNGKEIVIVEVKTTLKPEHIERFLWKLSVLKDAFPEYAGNTVYGAMAYLRSESESQLRAMRKGLFVIRATGNSSSIINSTDFQPTAF